VLHRRIWVTAIAAAMSAASPVAAQSSETSDLIAAIRLAVDRGEMLFLYDRVAWLGTDDFRDHYANLMGQSGGYVVTGDETRTELTFFDKAQSKAIYRATFTLGKLAKSGPPAADHAELTPLEKRTISAKEKALAAFQQANVALCAKANPNLTTIPSADPAGAIIVYLMTPQTALKIYPLGGHFSVEVGQDGSVGKVRRFTNTCIGVPLNQVPKDGKPVGFAITHLLDPTPTEIHVFTSLASKMPIYVGTKNERIWAVEGSRIRSVDSK